MSQFKLCTRVATGVECHLGLVEVVQIAVKRLDIFANHQDLLHTISDILCNVRSATAERLGKTNLLYGQQCVRLRLKISNLVLHAPQRTPLFCLRVSHEADIALDALRRFDDSCTETR